MMTLFDMLAGWLRTFTHKRRQSLTLTASSDALQCWRHWYEPLIPVRIFVHASDHPLCAGYISTDYEKATKSENSDYLETTSFPNLTCKDLRSSDHFRWGRAARYLSLQPPPHTNSPVRLRSARLHTWRPWRSLAKITLISHCVLLDYICIFGRSVASNARRTDNWQVLSRADLKTFWFRKVFVFLWFDVRFMTRCQVMIVRSTIVGVPIPMTCP